MQEILESMREALGLSDETLNVWQMCLRAVILYMATILMLRLGDRRVMGKSTAFDFILGIVLGSVVSRAITGNTSFLPAIGASVVLVGMHWLFAALSYYFQGFGKLVNGTSRLLIKDGVIQRESLRKSHISQDDLSAALHLNGKLIAPDKVGYAFFEKEGHISVIPRKREPHILEISVAEGVQTVRIELE